MAANLPAVIGRYRITGELGRGGMGIVLSAIDPALDRPVAVKLIRLDADGTQATELEQRFLREARVAARVTHSSIASVYDAGREGDSLFLVMELVQGESLAKRLAEGRFPTLPEALEIAAQVADGLSAAHAVGVVHRDIKPANILLTRAGLVKVSDFGVAKAVGESTELTRTGTVVGSPAYMAPEQIQGGEVDGRTDLFSLGVVLYEMLLHRRPFPADTVTTLIYQVLHRDPFEDSETLRVLGPDLAGLLRLALAKQPASRVPDGATFARVARGLARRTAGGAAPTTMLLGSAAESGRLAAARASGTATVGTAALGGSPAQPAGFPVAAPVAAPTATASVPPVAGRQWLPIAIGAVLFVAAVLLVVVQRRPSPPPSLGGTLTTQVAPATSVESERAPQPTAPAGNQVVPEAASPEPSSQPPIGAVTRQPFDRPVPGSAAAGEAAPPTTGRAVPSNQTQVSRPSWPAEPPAPPPATSAPPEPTPQPAPAPRVRFAATFECQSGAEFNVSPEDATVAVDGRAIGIADDWDGSGGAEAYTFPGPGTYTVRLSQAGYETAYVQVIVRPDADDEIADIDTELQEIEE